MTEASAEHETVVRAGAEVETEVETDRHVEIIVDRHEEVKVRQIQSEKTAFIETKNETTRPAREIVTEIAIENRGIRIKIVRHFCKHHY